MLPPIHWSLFGVCFYIPQRNISLPYIGIYIKLYELYVHPLYPHITYIPLWTARGRLNPEQLDKVRKAVLFGSNANLKDGLQVDVAVAGCGPKDLTLNVGA